MKPELTILLVEDDGGHATLMQMNLKRAGIINPIVRVRNGEEALDFVFRRGPFVHRLAAEHLLVLLDIKMPRVDGVEVLRAVKGHPATAKLPVIMLTTTDDPREINRCYELEVQHLRDQAGRVSRVYRRPAATGTVPANRRRARRAEVIARAGRCSRSPRRCTMILGIGRAFATLLFRIIE